MGLGSFIHFYFGRRARAAFEWNATVFELGAAGADVDWRVMTWHFESLLWISDSIIGYELAGRRDAVIEVLYFVVEENFELG